MTRILVKPPLGRFGCEVHIMKGEAMQNSEESRVIKGTYSDLKLVKTRKVLQMVIELPVEAQDDFITKFGLPKPDAEMWVAVARLHDAPVPAKTYEATKAVQDAGMACKDPNFGTWLHDSYNISSIDPLDAESIAEGLRAVLGVKSRSDFYEDEAALTAWKRLKSEYEQDKFK